MAIRLSRCTELHGLVIAKRLQLDVAGLGLPLWGHCIAVVLGHRR